MNEITYHALDVQVGQHILEIGFGGGDLIERILSTEQSLQMTAIDMSQTAVDGANKKFEQAISTHTLMVARAKAETIPFADKTFDAIATVNTLYFWSDISVVLQECQRCLKPGGKLIITYNSKAFLEAQQATQLGFQAYAVGEVEAHLKATGFDAIETTLTESVSNGTFCCTRGTATNAV